MALDLFSSEDIINRAMALSNANDKDAALAIQWGADPHIITVAMTAYQAALNDLVTSFGLRLPQPSSGLTIPQGEAKYHEGPIEGGE